MSTIKEYVLANFEADTIRDIVNHGMAAGFGQLIYYKDTCAFQDEYEGEIWQMLWDDAKNEGCGDILKLIAQFNGAENVGSMDQLKNLLCWYAVEKVCWDLVYLGDGLEANIGEEKGD